MSERIQFLIYGESTEPDQVVFTKNNMLYKRRTILFVFVILFVSYMYSVGFAQSGQGSDSSLSGSQYIDLIKEIRQLDTNMTKNMGELESKMRDHVDGKISALSTDINNLRQDVAFINGQLSIIKWTLTIIGGPLLVVIIGVLVNNYFQNRRNKNNVVPQSDVKENTDNTDTDILDTEHDPLDSLKQDIIREPI